MALVVAKTTRPPQLALGVNRPPRGQKEKKNLSKLLMSALLPLLKKQRPPFLHQSVLPLCASLSLHFNPNTNPYELWRQSPKQSHSKTQPPKADKPISQPPSKSISVYILYITCSCSLTSWLDSCSI
jgi:hypothetical protein